MTRCDVTLPSSYVDILTRVFYSYPLRERIIIILGKMMRCDVTLPSSDVDILTRVFYIPAEREGKHNFARYTKNYGRIQCTLYWVKKKKTGLGKRDNCCDNLRPYCVTHFCKKWCQNSILTLRRKDF